MSSLSHLSAETAALLAAGDRRASPASGKGTSPGDGLSWQRALQQARPIDYTTWFGPPLQPGGGLSPPPISGTAMISARGTPSASLFHGDASMAERPVTDGAGQHEAARGAREDAATVAGVALAEPCRVVDVPGVDAGSSVSAGSEPSAMPIGPALAPASTPSLATALSEFLMVSTRCVSSTAEAGAAASSSPGIGSVDPLPSPGPLAALPAGLSTTGPVSAELTESPAGRRDDAPPPTATAEPPAVREPLRVYAEWTAEGVKVWLGADDPGAATVDLVSERLRHWLAAQGDQLATLVCNGTVVWERPRTPSHDGRSGSLDHGPPSDERAAIQAFLTEGRDRTTHTTDAPPAQSPPETS